MKKIIFILCLSILSTLDINAKVLRVNNTGIPTAPASPNLTPVYTTAQSAHDAASTNDTLHFEASTLAYGSVTLTKKLTFIGPGYFLGSLVSNANPDLQAIPTSATISINLGVGSDNSEFTGLTIVSITVATNQTISGVIFKRNNITGQSVGLFLNAFSISGSTNFSNVQFIQNYISGTFTHTNSPIMNNYVFSNNIITGTVTLPINSSGIFQNNILTNNVPAFYNATVKNNINGYAGTPTITNCIVQNNISVNSSFGTADGNQQNVVMTTVFEDYNDASALFSQDSRFTLKTGSPALGTGYSGVDMGAILNPANTNNNMLTSYKLSGIPAIPSIYKLDVPTIVNSNSMNVTISTRSN